MSQCVGVAGRLFGHKYGARYSNHSEVVGVVVNANEYGWNTIKVKGGETPRKTELRTYHRDVCERCGGVVNAQPVPATKPELKLWPVLLRIAPKAKLNDLSDALFEQGFCLDMKLAPTELSASPPSDTERGERE